MNKGNPPVIELDEQDMDKIIKSHARLVIDCWAPWCPDCRTLAPVFDALAEDIKGKITFAQINVDTNQGVKDKYQVMAVPTLLLFKDGELTNRLVEPAPKKTVLQGEIEKSMT